jgi:hypothetical protein
MKVKNVWLDTKEAWKDIDKIFPTEAGPWDDQNDPNGACSSARRLVACDACDDKFRYANGTKNSRDIF